MPDAHYYVHCFPHRRTHDAAHFPSMSGSRSHHGLTILLTAACTGVNQAACLAVSVQTPPARHMLVIRSEDLLLSAQRCRCAERRKIRQQVAIHA